MTSTFNQFANAADPQPKHLNELLADGFEIKSIAIEHEIRGDDRIMRIVLQKGKKAMYCRSVDSGQGSSTSFSGNSECYEFYL
jgi:hypothetical protein